MRIFISVLTFLLAAIYCPAQQNLVPNSSFEQYSWCPPGGRGSIFHCEEWLRPYATSTDFHHLCNGRQDEIDRGGYQFPRTGEGMAAIGLFVTEDYMEYLAAELTEPLKADSTYTVTFFVNMADYSNFTCSNCFEAFLTTILTTNSSPQSPIPPYPGDPQIKQGFMLTDSIGWTEICGSFVAQGGEKYLIIGSFVHSIDLDLAGFYTPLDSIQPGAAIYAFIDDVSVRKVPGGEDSRYYRYHVCEDELPLALSARPGYDQYQWTNEFGDTVPNIQVNEMDIYWAQQYIGCVRTTDGHYVEVDTLAPQPDLGPDRYHCEADMIQPVVLDPGSPQPNYHWSTGDTTPTLTVQEPGIYFLEVRYEHCEARRDTVELLGCPPNFDYRLTMPNVFSPNGDGINDRFLPMDLYNLDWEQLSIFDRWGREVYVGQQPFPGWDGRYRGQNLPVGVYYYALKFLRPETGVREIRKGAVTLLR